MYVLECRRFMWRRESGNIALEVGWGGEKHLGEKLLPTSSSHIARKQEFLDNQMEPHIIMPYDYCTVAAVRAS